MYLICRIFVCSPGWIESGNLWARSSARQVGHCPQKAGVEDGRQGHAHRYALTWIRYKDEENGRPPPPHPISSQTAMYPDPGPSNPRHYPSLDTTSEFFQVLTAPYHPPPATPSLNRTQPRPEHVARCRAAINWTSAPLTESSSSSHPPTSSQPAVGQLDQPIYQPHGHWAWTRGLSIDDPKQLLSLRSGRSPLYLLHMMLIHSQRALNALLLSTAGLSLTKRSSISVESKCCKCCHSTDAEMQLRWKLSKQKEWYGFYSEVSPLCAEPNLWPTTPPLLVACPIQVGTIPPAPSRGYYSPHHQCPCNARSCEHYHGDAPLLILDRVLSEHAARIEGECDNRI